LAFQHNGDVSLKNYLDSIAYYTPRLYGIDYFS
jgi:hypothetical protein